MAGGIPALTGPQLSRLLVQKDGWTVEETGTHGRVHVKRTSDGTIRTTVIPIKNRPLPKGTLAAILGPKETGLGKAGLRRLLKLR